MDRHQSLTAHSEYLARLTSEIESWPELTPEQWNWQPPNEWSVGQCLDHIVVSGDEMVELIHRVWDKFAQVPEHDALKMTWLGTKIAEQSGPNFTMRVPVPKGMDPRTGPHDASVLEALKKQFAEIAVILWKARHVDTDSYKMTSPVAALVRYNLSDALTIMIGHADRHMIQARQRMQESGFPKAP